MIAEMSQVIRWQNERVGQVEKIDLVPRE